LTADVLFHQGTWNMTSEIRRFTRRELYDKVWRTAVDTLAREFRISGRGLGKLCERHGIPVPARGYWARKAAGQKVKRPALVELSDSKSPEITIDLRLPAPPLNVADAETPPSPTREFYERQLAEIEVLPVPPRLQKPHAIIEGWLKQEAIDRESARAPFFGRRTILPELSSSIGRRRLRILNVVFRELERRGFRISAEHGPVTKVTAEPDRDAVEIMLFEQVRRVRRRLSEEEMASSGYFMRKSTQTTKHTGELELRVTSATAKDVPSTLSDEDDNRLETRMVEFLAAILAAAAYVRARREEYETEQRRRREQEEEERRREAERRAERARELGLRQRAEAWRMAAAVRDYVAAVRTAAENDAIDLAPDALEEWTSWAFAHADALDPLLGGDPTATTLLWADERSQAQGYQRSTGNASLGDPDWFWGRRWWLKG
jgi:hypothetical protein